MTSTENQQIPVPNEAFSEDEFSQEPRAVETTIERYSHQVRKSFFIDFHRVGTVELSKDSPREDIQFMAEWISLSIIESNILGGDSDEPEFKMVETNIIQMLRTNAYLKAFLVASDRNMFKFYYPTLKAHQLIFQKGNQKISETIRNHFPSLITDGHLSKYNASELGHIIDAISKAAQKQMAWARLNATVESEAIALLIKQWKGKTSEGLEAIITAVERFECKYPAEKYLYSVPLMSLLNNYLGLGERLISNWYNQNFLKSQPASSMDVIKQFDVDLLPVLNVHAQERIVFESVAPAKVCLIYTAKLNQKKFANDFAAIKSL